MKYDIDKLDAILTDPNKSFAERIRAFKAELQDQRDRPEWAVGETKHYWITDNTVVCCGENASVYQCKQCEDIVECEFHNNLDHPHCEEITK